MHTKARRGTQGLQSVETGGRWQAGLERNHAATALVEQRMNA